MGYYPWERGSTGGETPQTLCSLSSQAQDTITTTHNPHQDRDTDLPGPGRLDPGRLGHNRSSPSGHALGRRGAKSHKTWLSRNLADESSWRAGFKGLLDAKYTEKEQRVPTCQPTAELHDLPESPKATAAMRINLLATSRAILPTYLTTR